MHKVLVNHLVKAVRIPRLINSLLVSGDFLSLQTVWTQIRSDLDPMCLNPEKNFGKYFILIKSQQVTKKDEKLTSMQ